MNVRPILLTVLILGAANAVASAQTPLGAPRDSVGRILQTSGVATGGYYRYTWPRRDLTLRIGDVTVSPALALGAWAGFSGDAADATMMGDLVLTSGEVKPVLAELARQQIEVTAIHNHLAGEDPKITYVHFHADGTALELAGRLDRVLARTSAPPALGYGTPINVQVVSPERAIATGDFTILAAKVAPVFDALTGHGITATALHSHLVGEEPRLYYMHFWADGPLPDVLRGLRAALDAAR